MDAKPIELTVPPPGRLDAMDEPSTTKFLAALALMLDAAMPEDGAYVLLVMDGAGRVSYQSHHMGEMAEVSSLLRNLADTLDARVQSEAAESRSRFRPDTLPGRDRGRREPRGPRGPIDDAAEDRGAGESTFPGPGRDG